jgi:O-acetyl-ADP-ribose deacetylase (regulator of RNase III)/uncharacterized protein YwgA
MFKALIGDLFTSRAQTLVNTVNCVGVMGKGVAFEFKTRFPEMFEDYLARCERKQVRLREPYLYHDLAGTMILNFPTKDHWRSPSRIADIDKGLDHFVRNYQAWGITSIAFPPLGCGNGGLEWADVGSLMYAKLQTLPISIEVYAPFGTPKPQLTEAFLRAPKQLSFDDKGRKHEKMNPDWVVLIEVLREIQSQPYANPVGRVIFQKICYVLTEMGLNTGFQFRKNSYGPFADEVKLALHDFANRNWVREEQLGQMLALHVSKNFEQEREKYRETIDRHAKKIAKTVDLFSRIKNTEQAEELITVFFASRELKTAHPNELIAERDVLDYVLSWKKAWRTPEKQKAVANSIRNLVMLDWMRLQFSDSLTEFA